MVKKKSTFQRSLKTLGLLALLVIFPLTSWYFLQTGLNFTKDKFDKMEELAYVDSFVVYPIYGDSVTNRTILGRMSVIANPGDSDRFLDSIKLIHEDLIDEEWVWMFLLNYDKASVSNLSTKYDFMLDSSAVKLVDNFSYSKSLNFFDREITIESNELGLIDTKGVLRYIYDMRNQEDMELFISHLVLLVPKE